MDINDIIKTYGFNDYLDMNTGRIYHLSKMEYHLFFNKTYIPVSEDGKIIGNVEVEGNLLGEKGVRKCRKKN